MSGKLTIAHITDIHIGETDAPRGIQYPRKNFVRVLEQMKETGPDLIVLGGDLAAENGEMESYRWIKKKMDSIEIPYCIVPGNHDLTENIITVFNHETGPITGKLYYKKRVKGRTLIFMDSTTNKLDPPQLDQFLIDCQQTTEDVILFIHHPPTKCGCAFMDENYPLLNAEQVFPVLEKVPNLKLIFCGHYHTEKTVIKNGKTLFITPSTLFQFSQTDPTFKINFNIESTVIGWRIIEITQKQIETRVHYL